MQLPSSAVAFSYLFIYLSFYFLSYLFIYLFIYLFTYLLLIAFYEAEFSDSKGCEISCFFFCRVWRLLASRSSPPVDRRGSRGCFHRSLPLSSHSCRLWMPLFHGGLLLFSSPAEPAATDPQQQDTTSRSFPHLPRASRPSHLAPATKEKDVAPQVLPTVIS